MMLVLTDIEPTNGTFLFAPLPAPPPLTSSGHHVQLYNAHTVGCDALWAGVPMVTLRGVKMASRVGASLVEAAGMPELVTDSLEEYTRLVQALARCDGDQICY